jgi:hypothetical protein
MQFLLAVSRIARAFRISHSHLTLTLRFSANIHFGGVHHFDRFAFLHQLKQFPNHLSLDAIPFQM